MKTNFLFMDKDKQGRYAKKNVKNLSKLATFKKINKYYCKSKN